MLTPTNSSVFQQFQAKLASGRQILRVAILRRLSLVTNYLSRRIDYLVNLIAKVSNNDLNGPLQAARAPITFGVYVILAFIIFGGLWSTMAPLNSAAVVVGTITSNTNKKTIQHPDGGIIKHIFVAQGDQVKKSQPLIELDDTRIRSQYKAILNQYYSALATENRLIAERDHHEVISFDAMLQNNSRIPEVAKIISTQKNLFQSQKEVHEAERQSLENCIAQSNQQIAGLEAQKVASLKNLSVAKNLLQGLVTLKAKKLIPKPTLLDMEIREANCISDITTIETSIIRQYQEITKKQIEITNLQNKFITETLKELRNIQGTAAILKEQLCGLTDQLQRVIIKSPVEGIVNAINYHTIGGFINQGGVVLEIIPSNDLLIIEAKVPHKDIASVHIGLAAKIRFSAFKSRSTPLFNGRVIGLSPSIVQDDQYGGRGDNCYVARIEIDMEAFNKVAAVKNLQLHPGMQAEIQIITGTRTLLKYLLDPITDAMFRAFREK